MSLKFINRLYLEIIYGYAVYFSEIVVQYTFPFLSEGCHSHWSSRHWEDVAG